MAHALRWNFGSFTAVLAAQLVACSEPPGAVVLVHEQTLTVQLHRVPSEAVDVLFVIDDSASMAQVQANLAANFGSFMEVLDGLAYTSYRVGVTTTDSGNPRCASDSSDRGALQLSPCTRRLDDFVAGDLDVRDVACNDVCTLTDAQLEIVATTTDHDSVAKPRPWLESIDGKTNLAAGVSMADAFECFAPQGVAGCDFESPLESMYLALDRVLDGQDPAYGFLRADATTMIVFMTDGHDCSFVEDWADIFSPEGDRTFWSDPGAAAPTSALCWNAGVECAGDPSHYDSCRAVDKDVDGELAIADDRAVLHPVERYIDRVQALEDLQRELDPQREVVVSLVGGVANNGMAYFAEADDPEFQDLYGIGPSCAGSGGVEAVPPVRLLEFTEAFTPANAFSICDLDYTPALQAIALKNWFTGQIQPACFPGCVEDLDLATEALDPDCNVEQRPPGRDNEWIEECGRTPAGDYAIDLETMDYTMPTADVDVCYALLIDHGGQTDDFADDLSMECTDLNFNLEFKIARRPGAPAPGGTTIYATCSLSEIPQVYCPQLGMSS